MNRLFPLVVVVVLLLVVGGVAATQGPPDGEECTNDKSGKSTKLPGKAAGTVDKKNPNVDCTDGEEDETIESLTASVSPNPATSGETVTVTITDQDGNPVPNASVQVESVGSVGLTDANGEVTFEAPEVETETTLNAEAEKGDAHVKFTVTVRPESDPEPEPESLTASVRPEPAWANEPVTITITDQDGDPVQDAKVEIESFGPLGTTDENGEVASDAPDVGGETTLQGLAYKGNAQVEFLVTVRPQPDVLAVHAGVSDGTVTVLVRDFDEVQNRSGFRDLGIPVPGVSVHVDGMGFVGETDENGEVTFDAPDVDRDTTLPARAEKGDVDRTFWVTIRPATSSPQTWYEDWDGDGFGNQEVTKEAVQQPFGFVATDDTGRVLIDCNDNDADLQENCDDPDHDDGFSEDPP